MVCPFQGWVTAGTVAVLHALYFTNRGIAFKTIPTTICSVYRGDGPKTHNI